MTYTDISQVPVEQINKLPVWAKNLLRSMDQKMEQLERRCDRMERRLTDANIFISDYPSDIPIAKDERIRFRFGERYEQCIEVGFEREHLIVHGGTSIAVLPHASNLCYVKLIQR